MISLFTPKYSIISQMSFQTGVCFNSALIFSLTAFLTKSGSWFLGVSGSCFGSSITDFFALQRWHYNFCPVFAYCFVLVDGVNLTHFLPNSSI